MNKIKNLIKRHFSSFVYFYQFIRYKVFVLIILSIAVSALDGFGLTLFLPLLQMLSGNGMLDSEQMGSLSFLIEGANAIGISLTLMSVLFAMIMFFIFKGIANYFNILYLVIIQQAFIKNIRLKLLRSLNVMNFKKFLLSDAGRIQNTMSGEVDRVSEAFISYFASFRQAVMVMVYLGFAFFIDAQFAILVTIGGGLTSFLYRIIYTRTKINSRILTASNHNYQGLVIQHVLNFKYLRATGMAAAYSEKLENTMNKIEHSRRKIGVLVGIGSATREPLLVIVIACVILIYINLLGGTMGGIVISLLFFYRALTSLVSMQQSWNNFLSVSGSLENMQSFQKELESSNDLKGKMVFDQFEKSIQCRNLSFSFGKTKILKNINLQITKNSSVAFVGESGSGKTTLVNVLTGLLDADQGEVFIDGKAIKDINKITYQKRIGYITQDAVIFNDTIFNNVSFWAEKTPENIQRYEKAVNQAALSEFIMKLPEGQETVLGNNGINLSGGQKQRISIARELFKEIDILIMDEATSALDSETEKSIQESIEALQGQYTLIIVAHRLSTIRNVDRVVFMHQGVIENEGNFQELSQNLPKFRKMVELQRL